MVVDKNLFLTVVNVFSLFCYYLPWKGARTLHLKKFECRSPKEASYQVWLILAQWFWSEKISSMYFLLFRYYIRLEKVGDIPLNKFESSSPKDVLCQVWLKLALWLWRRFVKIVLMYLRYFVVISP